MAVAALAAPPATLPAAVLMPHAAARRPRARRRPALALQRRGARHGTTSPNQYADYVPGQGGYQGGAYGPWSAPRGWTGGPNRYEEQPAPEWDADKALKYGADLRPRHWNEMGGEQSGKARFRMAVARKTQAELDAELEAEKRHLPDLSEGQRQRIRSRRDAKQKREDLRERMHALLRCANWGRRNSGILNKGDWNVGLLNRGDHNTGFLCFGDHNSGVLLFGNDNKGFAVRGSGNVGAFIYGDQNRGVDIWGDKIYGMCRTADQYMKFRMKCVAVFAAVFFFFGSWLYGYVKERRLKQFLRGMDVDDSDERALAAMGKRSGW
eukprot:TRINITY_DN65230_c0_g1_i1.p1 TRINITY_DN65230_c0_g1~~TRINITY_DN65230_c0_g1_i1.p1  ORF type:complete len:323 (+),score=98.08 TRINITY_DN65230_c0_g1_i1:93-1061(+)